MDKSMLTVMDDSLESSYVSCIKVDGRPILPPVMNESKREEMRNYKKLAIARELRRKYEREQSRVKNLQSSPLPNAEAFNFGCLVTSTPITILQESRVSTSPIPPRSTSRTVRYFDNTTTGETTAVELPIREQEPSAFLNFATHFVIKSPHYNAVQVPPEETSKLTTIIRIRSDENTAAAKNEDTDNEDESNSSSSTSGGNFASVASSTGTFIIQSDPNRPFSTNGSSDEFQREDSKSEDEMESIKGDDEDEKDGNCIQKPPMTPRTNSSTPPVNRRKRPANYFDSDEDEKEEEKDTSQFSKNSQDTSLGKYMNISNVTWSSGCNTVTGSGRTVDPGFDVRLSAEIPTSAEASPMSNKGGKGLKTESGEDSDKENQAERSKKHIRRLSYTLSGPSDLLLATVNQDDQDNTETKSTAGGDDLMAPPALSTIPSSNATPVKLIIPTQFENPTPSNLELDRRIENLDRHLAELQLGMGLNKRKHMERYLGDMVATNNEVNISTVSVNVDTDLEIRLKQLQENQERELAALAEKHRLQEAKLKEDLEALRDHSLAVSEVKAASSSKASSVKSMRSPLMKSIVKNNEDDEEDSYYIPPPTASIKSVESHTHGRHSSLLLDNSPGKQSTRSFVSVSSTRSRFTSASNSNPSSVNPTPRERFYEQQQVTLTLTEGSTPSIISAANSVISFGNQPSVGRIGLSSLQKRIKSMSPSMFNVALDSRSPLLKGVVYLDPLDRPPVRRIPNEANDPAMKAKFDRVSATVKGYLVRRLLHTERIQNLIQTIQDTVDLLLKLYDEAPRDRNSSGFQVQPEEMELNRRLIQQLHGACSSFHDVFFKLSTKERMAIISTDRAKLRAKAIKSKNPMSPSAKTISTATMKSMERRLIRNRDRKESPGSL